MTPRAPSRELTCASQELPARSTNQAPVSARPLSSSAPRQRLRR